MKLVEHKTTRGIAKQERAAWAGKIEQEYVNNKGKTKTRKIKEHYTQTNTYFYEKNHLGSIVAISAEDASIIEEYAYDIFGKAYSKDLDGTITRLKKSPIGNTRLYTGREYDRGLKLYYNRARYYNPQLGRFISRDPIDIADDVNLYAYVGNNSIMFVDLMGLGKMILNVIYRPTITGGHLSVELDGAVYTYVASAENRYTVGFLSVFMPSTSKYAVDAVVEKIDSDEFYDFFNEDNNLIIHEYSINEQESEKNKNYLKDSMDNDVMKYNLLGTNCSTFVQSVLYIGWIEKGISDTKLLNGIPAVYNKTLMK